MGSRENYCMFILRMPRSLFYDIIRGLSLTRKDPYPFGPAESSKAPHLMGFFRRCKTMATIKMYSFPFFRV